MAQFVVNPDQIRTLAGNRRFVASLVALAWPELLNTGCVVTKARYDPGHLFLDEWTDRYRRHMVKWADKNSAQLEEFLESLAAALAGLATELTSGSGGRPHTGG